MIGWMWVAVCLGWQWYVLLTKPGCTCKGKILSAPMLKLFKVKSIYPVTLSLFRCAQILGGSVILTIMGIPDIIFYLWFIGLYLDDYLATDDNFKRFWGELRNKIKWKMELPPVVAGSRVGS